MKSFIYPILLRETILQGRHIPFYGLRRAHFKDITQSTSLTKLLGGAATRHQT